MRMRPWILIGYAVTFLSVLFFVYTANTEQSDPAKTISELVSLISKNMVSDTKMKDVASKDKKIFEEYRTANQKFHKKIAEFIDFEKLGTDSMHKKWQDKYWSISSGEKKKFLALLQTLIEEIVYPRGKDFFENVKIVYHKPKYSSDQKQVDLRCTVHVEKKEVELLYRLIRRGTQWKIFDVNIEGEWWTDSFKNKFNHIITTKSYDELISAMKKKLGNVQAGTSF